jgi:hypothetical protein
MSRVEAAALRLIARCLADPTNDTAIGAVLALLDHPFQALESTWGSQHYAAFELNGYPFAGVYLSDPVVGDARKIWMGLSAAASRMEAGDQRGVSEALNAHVLPMIAPMHRAVNSAQQPIPDALFVILNDLLRDHPCPPMEALVPPPDLAAKSTGLGDLTHHLTTPIRCGFLLTKADMGRLGTLLELPRGFGDRRLELMNLFRGAARFDKVPELIANLETLVQEATAHQARCWPHAQPWQRRLLQTAAWLAQMDAEKFRSIGDRKGDFP